MREQQQFQKQMREHHVPVEPIARRLQEQVRAFEARLNPDEEIGLWLVSFGPDFVFHANKIRIAAPSLIIFEGVTSEGEQMELVQHHSQMNILFKAVKRREDSPSNPIGFIWDG